MKMKSNFELVKIADDYMLIPVGDKMDSFNGTVVLNEVSAFLIEKMQDKVSESDLVKLLTEEFDVDLITAKEDVHEAINEMKRIDIIDE